PAVGEVAVGNRVGIRRSERSRVAAGLCRSGARRRTGRMRRPLSHRCQLLETEPVGSVVEVSPVAGVVDVSVLGCEPEPSAAAASVDGVGKSPTGGWIFS